VPLSKRAPFRSATDALGKGRFPIAGHLATFLPPCTRRTTNSCAKIRKEGERDKLLTKVALAASPPAFSLPLQNGSLFPRGVTPLGKGNGRFPGAGHLATFLPPCTHEIAHSYAKVEKKTASNSTLRFSLGCLPAERTV